MPGLQIPMKTASTGGAAADYETTIDSAYDLYTTQLKNYPVANALEFEAGKYTQEFWGLQLTSRSAQNTSFQDSLSLGAASGSTALNLYSRTSDFTKNIKQIVQGNLKTGAFFNTFSFSSLNKNEGFVANSGGNKFLISAYDRYIQVTPVTSDYEINGDTTQTEIDRPNLGNYAFNGRVYIASVVNNYIWVWYMANPKGNGSNQDGYAKNRGSLYSIDSDGALTLVNHGTVYSGAFGDNATNGNIDNITCGSHTYNGTCYSYLQNMASWTSYPQVATRILQFHAIDLSNTTAFTTTVRYQHTASSVTTLYEGGNADTGINVAFDNATNTIYYIAAENEVWSQVGTSAPTDTGQEGDAGSVDEEYMLKTYDYFYNGTGAYTQTTNIVNQSGNVSGITSQTQKDNIVSIYEITSLTQDQNTQYKGTGINGGNFKNIGVSSVTDLESINYQLLLNDTSILNKDIAPFTSTGNVLEDVALNQETVNAKYLKFELKTLNPNAINHKIAFGVTGGTYATPTFNYEVSTLNVLL